MAIKLEYKPSQNILIGAMEGTLSIEMYKQTMDKIISTNEYPTDVPTLWDLRKLDFSSIDSNFVDQVTGKRKEINRERKNAKLAMVVDSDLGYGMTRMYQIFSELAGLSQKVEIFKNIEEAKDWLLEDQMT